MNRFENVDVLAALEQLMRQNTAFYRKDFEIDKENQGKRALLCFNAADYKTDVWINGVHILTHTGGFTPFFGDITECLKKGENVLVVRCEDTLNDAVPRGKQSWTGSPSAAGTRCFCRFCRPPAAPRCGGKRRTHNGGAL